MGAPPSPQPSASPGPQLGWGGDVALGFQRVVALDDGGQFRALHIRLDPAQALVLPGAGWTAPVPSDPEAFAHDHMRAASLVARLQGVGRTRWIDDDLARQVEHGLPGEIDAG